MPGILRDSLLDAAIRFAVASACGSPGPDRTEEDHLMKRTALLFSCALMAAPVFANDLCTVNLQKLDDATTTKTTLMDPLKTQVEDLHEKAKQDQAAGKTEDCASNANQALMLLQKADSGGDSGAAN